MLKRKITDTLCEWKADPQHKPLIIKGPRQCGKTFSVLDFAKKRSLVVEDQRKTD